MKVVLENGVADRRAGFCSMRLMLEATEKMIFVPSTEERTERRGEERVLRKILRQINLHHQRRRTAENSRKDRLPVVRNTLMRAAARTHAHRALVHALRTALVSNGPRSTLSDERFSLSFSGASFPLLMYLRLACCSAAVNSSLSLHIITLGIAAPRKSSPAD